MPNSITLPIQEENSSVDAEKVVVWAQGFDGVDAHIVWNYIPIGDGMERGDLNGVTIQWAHEDTTLEPAVLGDATIEFVDRDGDEQSIGVQYVDVPALVAPTATEAVHVRPGQTITRTKNGFEVTE